MAPIKKKIKNSNEKTENKITNTSENIINNVKTQPDRVIDQTKKTKKKIDLSKDLSTAINKTNELESLFQNKQKELESLKSKQKLELQSINQNIKSKSDILEIETKNTKYFLEKLSALNKKIESKYSKMSTNKLIKVMIKSNENDEDNTIEKIKTNNKIIENNNKLIKKNKTQKMKLEKINIDENKNNLLSLQSELEELTNKENNLKKKIKELNLIKKNHEQNCEKIISTLEAQLQILKSDLENENKKKQLNDEEVNKNNNTNTKSCLNSSSTDLCLPKITDINNNSNNLMRKKRISELHLTESNKKNKSIILKDLDEIKRRIKLNSDLNKNSNIKTEANETRVLLTENESNILNQIIPTECIKIYEDKFNQLEEQRMKIQEKLDSNITNKKLIKKKNKILSLSEDKIKETNRKGIDLHYKITEAKKKSYDINKEMNLIKKELKAFDNKYNKKKEESDLIKKNWLAFYNDIKNDKIKLRKGISLTQDDIDIIQKYGGPLEVAVNSNWFNINANKK